MQEKYTKEEAKSLSVGLYVALALIAGTIFFTSQRKEIEHAESGDYYALNARFGRTDGLQIGDKVRLAGVTVGRVVGAKLDDHFNAIMTMELKDGIRIPDDSSASIVSSGIMGAKYIEFSYTQDAMVIEELVDRIISIGKANRSKAEDKKIDEMEKEFDLN